LRPQIRNSSRPFRWLCLVLVLLGNTLNICSYAAELPKQRLDELRQLLIKLHTTARLMHTTAHPDDEDGGMLTLESRGKGASVLLLTLNRGEGGQNKMGSNLLDVLGVVRTLELLASDAYYGVEQRFTRVADFGFSKTPEETFEKWHGHDVALADMVRAIRSFRPDVLVSRFQGTARDGHGHHSAAGILTREAFRAAADPNRFPDQIKAGLAPWQPKKLYIDNVRPPEEHTLTLDTGTVDPLLGMSYVQYAMQGLKHQLSQGAGAWNVSPGQHFSYYRLVDSVLPASAPTEQDFFDGIDTSVPGLAGRLGNEEASVPFLRPALMEIARDIQNATTAVDSNTDSDAAVPLLAGLGITQGLLAKVEGSTLSPAAKSDLLVNLRTKRDQLQRAADLALGIELHASVDAAPAASANDTFVAVPGQTFAVTVKLINHGALTIKPRSINLDLPAGWSAKALDPQTKPIDPGGEVGVQFTVAVPSDAPLTRPYWHRNDPETDAAYTLDEPQYATLPFPPPPVNAHADYEVAGETGSVTTTAQVAYRDPSGELHEMPLAVEPALSVALEPATQVLPLEKRDGVDMQVTVSKNLMTAVHAQVRLQLPPGWRAEPPTAAVDMKQEMRQTTLRFHVVPGQLRRGKTTVRAVAEYEGKSYSEGYTVVARPDLDTFFYYQPAEQRVSVVDVKVRKALKVGYIMGAGDDIPTVLRQAGIDISIISEQELATGDLQRFDTIATGIRAYDTREELRKYNSRLLDYVSAGGTLLVQYNTGVGDFNAGHFTPYPAQLSRERVSVEDAPVDMLQPQLSIFHFPNAITPADFQGWVQERGLYFMDNWDPHYEPLLKCHDPGEAPQKGGLLLARYGKGTYMYTGYSFFRQLPAGVPGAIRLFVNLVSAGHEGQRTHQ
jgi:LmbE family N-acetylglucosaminyl deacetylase